MKPSLIIGCLYAAITPGVVRGSPKIQDIPIDPMLETSFDWEENITESMNDRLVQLISKQYAQPSEEMNAQTGHKNQMLRDAHPKGIACVTATLKIGDLEQINKAVLPRFPKQEVPFGLLQKGIFAGKSNKEYRAVVRFSSSAATVKPDYEPDARGMAVKIMGVIGEKWPLTTGPSSARSGNNQFTNDSFLNTQDFVMIDHPFFPIKNAQGFNDLIAVALGLPDALRGFLMPSANPGKWRFGEIAAFLRFNTKPPANLLTKTFHSITPYSFSGYPTKFMMAPRTGEEKIPSGSKDKNILRNMADATLSKSEVVFDFSIQLRPRYEAGVDIKRIVEDASTDWTKETQKYPFIKVATLTIPKQTVSDQKKLTDCDNLSFNIWNSVKDYRPLGSINRSRRVIYEHIALFRKQFNKTLDK